jgi:aldehyde:ferredoxin oxidoreductase
MGADHTAGYSVAPSILKIGGDLDPLKPDGQCAVSQGLQEATAGVFDSTGLCQFLAFACLDQPDSLAAIPEMLSARFGVELNAGDLVGQGASTLETEREFNRRAGMTPEDDRLPGFFYTEELPPHNSTWDVPDAEIDAVCGRGPLTEHV